MLYFFVAFLCIIYMLRHERYNYTLFDDDLFAVRRLTAISWEAIR
jgi:hypothetical protein